MSLPARLEAALARRAPLASDPRTTAYRLINGAGDDLEGLTLDRFEDVLVLSLYRDLSEAEERGWVDRIAHALSPRALYVKRRPREARVVATTQKAEVAPELPASGAPVESLVARENDVRFHIRPAQGLSVGLYLDMRQVRAWLSGRVRGKTVLNCFAYTCAFGVVARLGGAARAANVDLSRRVLDWGEENLGLNGVAPERRDFISGDVFDWLARFAKKGEAFDTVVLDPPSFASSRRRVFSAERDYATLAAAGAAVVARGGTLLACCNQASLGSVRFAAQVREGLARAGRQVRGQTSLGPSPIDFPSPGGQEPALKVLAVSLD